MENTVVFIMFTKLCNHHPYLIPEYFCHPNKKPDTETYIFFPQKEMSENLILKDTQEAYSL